MKMSKGFFIAFAVVSVGLFGSSVYASEVNESNVKVVTVKDDDKKVDIILSDDKYVRITSPEKINTSESKVKMSTFESKTNIMGETNQGTAIVIEVYGSTKSAKDGVSFSKTPDVYKLDVGITESFNQLIDLSEGENKVILIYTNDKDKKYDEKMIFYITRESEKTKESVKKPDSVLSVFDTIK